MKWKCAGIVATVLLFIILGIGTAPAVQIYDREQWFEVIPSGPISVEAGGTLTLTVVIRNTTDQDQVFRFLQATVIDPFSGTRIYGPLPTEPAPGKVLANSTLRRTLQIGPITESNKTLGVMIMVLDSSQALRGVAGWGFVVQ